MKIKSKNRGITLISLVITIIVMLILVGVSITLAVNGGLFEYAGNAVGDTKNAIAEENEIGNGGIKVDGKDYSIIEIIEGTVPNPKEKFSEIYTENKKITEEVDGKTYTAWIPKGFAVGTSNGINTITEGLVITDKVNSEGQSVGNEFVWIPVEVVKEGENVDSETSIASFYRSNWTSSGRGTTKYTATSGSSYNEPLISGGYKEEETEYKDMLKSVYTYEGFYIGRYEAGTDTARTNTSNETSKMVVQRDKYPYIYVGWGALMTDYTNPITYNSKNQGLGALALSKRMYPTRKMCDEDTSLTYKDVGVTSTLCYGVMWDAMLEFISKEKNLVNSTTWGNYYDNAWEITRATAKWTTSPSSETGWTLVGEKGKTKTSSESILLTTGANDNFSAKNIYDVAGNVWEWTNEAYSTSCRVIRGGYCVLSGGVYPASYRSYDYSISCNSNIGFRPALYITNND